MTGIETALLVASTAVSAVGAIASGNAQASAQRGQATMEAYNARVMEQNAANARETAQNERAVASQQEDEQRRRARAVIGSQAAAGAQSGVANTGSQALSLEDSATQAELDALNIRYEGQMRSRATELQAQGFDQQAEMSRMASSQAKRNATASRIGGYIGAGTAMLKGASSYYGGGVKVGSGVTSTAYGFGRNV